MTDTAALERTAVTTEVGLYRADHLAAALRTVSVFAETDKFLPGLIAVHLQASSDGALQFTATNRYVVGRDTVRPAVDNGEKEFDSPVSMLLSMEDVKDAITWLKRQGAVNVPVTIEHGIGGGWDGGIAAVRFGYETRQRFATKDTDGYTYPKIDHLFAGEWTGEIPSVMFNGDYLAKFATKNLKRDRHESSHGTRFRFRKNERGVQCVKVEFSDHFVGLIMPMRDPEA